jgi:hypothetical protein
MSSLVIDIRHLFLMDSSRGELLKIVSNDKRMKNMGLFNEPIFKLKN